MDFIHSHLYIGFGELLFLHEATIVEIFEARGNLKLVV